MADFSRQARQFSYDIHSTSNHEKSGAPSSARARARVALAEKPRILYASADAYLVLEYSGLLFAFCAGGRQDAPERVTCDSFRSRVDDPLPRDDRRRRRIRWKVQGTCS